MDAAQEVLFGRFPRMVGNPEQFPVLDGGSFDAFVEANNGDANCYSRISWLANTGDWMTDRVFLDLDGHVSENGLTQIEFVSKLRSDSVFAEEVLGDVVEDVRKIAELAFEESVPLVGVYTGKGVHIHWLTEERRFPPDALKSNQKWLTDVCSLKTVDRQVFGDVKRLSRVPNCKRYDEKVGSATDLFTIPLSRSAMRDLTVDELLDWSASPRSFDKPGGSRPPLFVRDDYLVSHEPDDVVMEEPVEIGERGYDELDEKIELWLEDVLQLPCMYERITTKNPAHPVRMNCAVMMFNVGMTPEDVVEVFGRLGWHDFDPSVTRKFAKQIYRQGYADMSCATIQSKGLCVYDRHDRQDECDAFGYPGGNQDW